MSPLINFLITILEGITEGTRDVWSRVWWIVIPLIVSSYFWFFWLYYIRYKFIVAINWDIIEVKVPKGILKTPKAMEQIFAAVHAPYSYGLRFLEKYWEGIVEYWFSFELVGFAGESHFYIRTPKQFRNLVESAVYSQYPGAEIKDAVDYVGQMPYVLPDKKFDLYGNEQIFLKPSCYPIRTYPMFEESVEERRVDPIAGILETMSKLKGDEQIWLQMLVRPIGNEWTEEGEQIVNKMLGNEEKKKQKFMDIVGFGVTAGEVVRSPFEHPSLEVKKKEREQAPIKLMLHPGEKEVMEGITQKISKLGFQTTIRFIYIDKRESFNRSNVAAVMGFFRQFNTQNCNLLRPNKLTMTAGIHWFFKPIRMGFRKRVIYERYRDLSFGPKEPKPVFNIEELATIYHFPILGVESTYLEKVESKKGGPPATLPMIDEEII